MRSISSLCMMAAWAATYKCNVSVHCTVRRIRHVTTANVQIKQWRWRALNVITNVSGCLWSSAIRLSAESVYRCAADCNVNKRRTELWFYDRWPVEQFHWTVAIEYSVMSPCAFVLLPRLDLLRQYSGRLCKFQLAAHESILWDRRDAWRQLRSCDWLTN